MKTARNLWPGLISWPNMLLALRRRRRRKRYSAAAAEFDFDSMNNLLHLQRELVGDSWVPGPYHHFRITDPKPRKISAAPFRDRIGHHAIVNVLEPVFEPRFIFDSYACRRGKGTHKAIQRAQQYLRRYSWSLKTDIVKFFPSIDHELLLHASKTHVAPATQPLSFLGLRISRQELRLRSSGIRRFSRRIRRMQHQFDAGRISWSDLQTSLRAWLAHCGHANSQGLVRDLLKRLRFRRRSARLQAKLK